MEYFKNEKKNKKKNEKINKEKDLKDNTSNDKNLLYFISKIILVLFII